MRALWWWVAIFVASVASPAVADPPATPPAPEERSLGSFAIGVNSPFGWFQRDTRSIGASLFLGVTPHFAARASFARYENPESLWRAIASGENFGPRGTFIDAGLACTWFPRRLWEGPTLELGALWRGRDTTLRPGQSDEIKTDSNMYGPRAMVGWSWLVTRHIFVAVAVGGSLGYETGRATTGGMTKSVSRGQADGEGYFRIGFAYGR